MRLICPACGAQASLEAWADDAGAREVLAAVCALPGPVVAYVPAYLALFRPLGSGRALSWKRAKKIVAELAKLTAGGHVQRGGRVARPCPPTVWAQALEKITQFAPRQLPLTSHGYLTEIAYGMADEADRAAETARNQAERSGRLNAEIAKSREPGGEPEPIMTVEQMRAIRQAAMAKRKKVD